MSTQTDLTKVGVIKCAQCGLLGDTSNTTYFEEKDFYVHHHCIEKIVEKNPIDDLLERMKASNGNHSDIFRTPRDSDRLMRLLIIHYEKAKPLLKWDSINDVWDEV